MGRVYLARQLDLGRQVVIKVMHEHIAADPKFCERFQRETLLMARFQHPYAVTLYDASLNDPQGPCIVMEYIKGVSLDTMLQRNGRFTAPRFSRLLGQMCEALQSAHSLGIVHRDLKPANLMVVDADTPYEKMKVMDFGLAKMAPRRQNNNSDDTNSEFAVGTPGYISPEQVRGEKTDHRSDLYSIGVILYEMLTGRLPFNGSETMDVLLAHAQDAPPDFNEIGLDSAISPSVEQLVMTCLAKQPNKRPQSARELADMFEKALVADQGHETITYTPRPLGNKPDTRKKLPKQPGPNVSTPIPAKRLAESDPSTVVHHLHAWMHESIAVYKLRGFINEVGGRVIESVPGRVHMRLGGKGSSYSISSSGPLSWLGLGRKVGIDLELLLENADNERQGYLAITVIMRPTEKTLSISAEMRKQCNEIFCDLRGFLMGSALTSS